MRRRNRQARRRLHTCPLPLRRRRARLRHPRRRPCPLRRRLLAIVPHTPFSTPTWPAAIFSTRASPRCASARASRQRVASISSRTTSGGNSASAARPSRRRTAPPRHPTPRAATTRWDLASTSSGSARRSRTCPTCSSPTGPLRQKSSASHLKRSRRGLPVCPRPCFARANHGRMQRGQGYLHRSRSGDSSPAPSSPCRGRGDDRRSAAWTTWRCSDCDVRDRLRT
mmetsp:Transcript_1971/g.5501  ORF Transcript_1971/g.5501 Transcript_1971/m.5501 type:complete len:226 (-) Transcript_1971:288-965(-)